MRIRFVGLSIVVMLWAAVPARAAGGPPPFYLSLGDSLAQGVQWSPLTHTDIITTDGYVDDLDKIYTQVIPGLQLAKLGCPGETTTSMIHGNALCYPVGMNQLDLAIAFLQDPRYRVAFITLDIGANDVEGCVSATGIDAACVQAGLNSVAVNLPLIVSKLRRAAPHTPIVAMNYYDPFLALWALGVNGPKLALQSLEVATAFNVLLESVYGIFRVPVADVAAAFQTYNLLPMPGEDVPVDVFRILSLTWMTVQDIHPNHWGYWVIADAFAKKLITLR